MNSYTHSLTWRTKAVRRVADALADRTSFVITIPPGTAQALASSLAQMFPWTAYLDNGTGEVLATSDAGSLEMTDLFFPVSGVLLVPKTVPASALSRVVGQTVPADGSQDIIVLIDRDGGSTVWPWLFIEALALVDPDAAAQIKAETRVDEATGSLAAGMERVRRASQSS
ncbi:hypothetical protein OHV05_10115 [Kitasatospora sp. NBC_00070]|uniref:hypothetical protein n=1 Tax=Kitasatospora sp. NBC_00070 TaxID=2975962 RepID=UPI00325602BF